MPSKKGEKGSPKIIYLVKGKGRKKVKKNAEPIKKYLIKNLFFIE